jgi:uncharacterized membrane protein YdbT with pleckstrin-like domain
MPDVGYENSLAGEAQVLVFHPHWKPLLYPVLAVVIAAEVLIPSSKGTSAERWAVAVAVISLLMLWLLYSVLSWRITTYELTTRHLRIRTGTIARTERDIPLSLITDVSFRKGLLDRLLGCGTLVVTSEGEHGKLVLYELPHVERTQATLSRMVRAGRGD